MQLRFADLELGLHRRDAARYLVELRFSQPDGETDIRVTSGDGALVQFDLAALRRLELDNVAYGQALTASLFAAPALRIALAQVFASVHSLDIGLRLRLFIGPSAPELHTLRWETLRHPETDQALLLGEHVLFSRYLTSGDWRPIRLRPRGALRALIVVANPANLVAYNLAPIDVAGELERAQGALSKIPLTALAGTGHATLQAMMNQLREGYDILYLVCHGGQVDDETWLWLEDEVGQVSRVSGSELAARLQELTDRPSLVVLAPCQSAFSTTTPIMSDTGPLAGLGPQLAESGIPAVLAMQGTVTMASAAEFMTVFFEALQRDGQIDRAVALARGAIREQPDYWMPVLFLRLRSGRMWYIPGVGKEGQTFEKWPAIVRNIALRRCTPILGNQLNETLLGSQRELAQRWAETYHFPMAPYQREDFPQVAQYLAINQEPSFPQTELVAYLREELLRRFGAVLPLSVQDAPLDELFATIGAHQRSAVPSNPVNVLATLPFPIYVTVTTDNLLVEALKAEGKTPRVEFCRWNEEIARLPSIYDNEPGYAPSAEQPLVFHLFGINSVPESLVLTEDQYFDYLRGVSLIKELIPHDVRAALADTALIFLGFRLEDWSFRVIFRSIMTQEGRYLRRRYASVAGQILPEEGAFLAPERAQRYLEGYFEDVDVNIFWGSVDDFAQELQRQWLHEQQRRPTSRGAS